MKLVDKDNILIFPDSLYKNPPEYDINEEETYFSDEDIRNAFYLLESLSLDFLIYSAL